MSAYPSDITTSTKTAAMESLLGDWHVLSVVVPVGTTQFNGTSGVTTLTADLAWQGTMMHFTADSVRIHRNDLAYPAANPGETTDKTLFTYPATYDASHVTINGCSLSLFPQEEGTLVLRGGNVEIEILKD